MEITKYSKEWWNNEFKSTINWTNGIDGNKQTQFFADITYGLISPTIKEDIFNSVLSFVDFGCAYGQGLSMLKKLNPDVKRIGIDYSIEALKESMNNNSDCEFYDNLYNVNDDIGLIYASQIVGVNPKDLINYFTQYAKQYIVILTPYEYEIEGIKIEENTFKKALWDKPEWRIVQNVVISKIDDFYTGTKQQLIVIKKIF